MTSHARTRRLAEQEWMFDRIIQANGPDFYWPMTEETLVSAGMDAAGDIGAARSAIKAAGDVTPVMASIGEKRRAMAEKAEADGHPETACENYFTAAACYMMAQGPIHEDDNELNLRLNESKNACYDRFIALAGRPIERVEIPFEDGSLPGILHLPPDASGPVPCIVLLGGLDNFKEILVRGHHDKIVDRGMAVLTFDGPGQNDALISRKIRCDADNFIPAGINAMDYLLTRPEIDADRIGIAGVSMGSFWLVQILANDPRYKAGAGFYICHEPGMGTIFDVAIPVFKDRYMWMAGYNDEAAFDKFAKTLTLEGLGAKINRPVLFVAGEKDELSPIEHTYALCEDIAAPTTVAVFKGEVHGVTDHLDVRALIADWMKDRFDGKPLESSRILIDARAGSETIF
ncbi:MAG: alpha/beta hydrolase [Rhodospirillales bacterium]|jgi:dienelactone hydrolase|nr:hypothetical protein [Rhodospirillaceae bacterium]MDP6427771.1 alpha/beta hydrolase [Rhodospirillales bacterium]MDP6644595.1 alpha/beta hydrolase [Rhodospirillales bacterium]